LCSRYAKLILIYYIKYRKIIKVDINLLIDKKCHLSKTINRPTLKHNILMKGKITKVSIILVCYQMEKETPSFQIKIMINQLLKKFMKRTINMKNSWVRLQIRQISKRVFLIKKIKWILMKINKIMDFI
jgi:hypothetical protein